MFKSINLHKLENGYNSYNLRKINNILKDQFFPLVSNVHLLSYIQYNFKRGFPSQNGVLKSNNVMIKRSIFLYSQKT